MTNQTPQKPDPAASQDAGTHVLHGDPWMVWWSDEEECRRNGDADPAAMAGWWYVELNKERPDELSAGEPDGPFRTSTEALEGARNAADPMESDDA